MNSTKIDPKYITKSNPRIGLIALASDFMIERDFINVIKDREVDFFVNRIECYNQLTKENLKFDPSRLFNSCDSSNLFRFWFCYC